jgi:hypothetical protein
MLSHAKLPEVFWREALFTTNYSKNMSPTKSVSQNKNPFELWFQRQPNLSFQRFFGCKAHVLIQQENRKKLHSHLQECTFLGYSE